MNLTSYLLDTSEGMDRKLGRILDSSRGLGINSPFAPINIFAAIFLMHGVRTDLSVPAFMLEDVWRPIRADLIVRAKRMRGEYPVSVEQILKVGYLLLVARHSTYRVFTYKSSRAAPIFGNAVAAIEYSHDIVDRADMDSLIGSVLESVVSDMITGGTPVGNVTPGQLLSAIREKLDDDDLLSGYGDTYKLVSTSRGIFECAANAASIVAGYIVDVIKNCETGDISQMVMTEESGRDKSSRLGSYINLYESIGGVDAAKRIILALSSQPSDDHKVAKMCNNLLMFTY